MMTALIQKLSLGLIALVAVVFSLEKIPPKKVSPPPTATPKTVAQKSPQPSNLVSLSFSTPKLKYSSKEMVPLEVVLQGSNPSLAAVQLRISYSANLKAIEVKAPSLLPFFNYLPNKNIPAKREFQIAAILKDSQKPFPLKGKVVFTKINFQPLAAGVATISFSKDTAVYQSGSSTNLGKSGQTLTLEIVP